MNRHILNEIELMGIELCSPHNDGFTTWDIKKQLYLIQDRINKIMERAPTHVGEQEWLDENINKKEKL